MPILGGDEQMCGKQDWRLGLQPDQGETWRPFQGGWALFCKGEMHRHFLSLRVSRPPFEALFYAAVGRMDYSQENQVTSKKVMVSIVPGGDFYSQSSSFLPSSERIAM